MIMDFITPSPLLLVLVRVLQSMSLAANKWPPTLIASSRPGDEKGATPWIVCSWVVRTRDRWYLSSRTYHIESSYSLTWNHRQTVRTAATSSLQASPPWHASSSPPHCSHGVFLLRIIDSTHAPFSDLYLRGTASWRQP